MRKLIFAVPFLLACSVFAQKPAPTFSNASLNGTYSFQFNSPIDTEVHATIGCVDALNNPFTFDAEASFGTRVNVFEGVATFDGAGHVSLTLTSYGAFDLNATQAALQAAMSCNGTVGQVDGVFLPPSPVTGTGTYSIGSDGTGTMSLSLGNAGSPVLDVRLSGMKGQIASTVMMRHSKPDNAIDGTGFSSLE